MMGVCRPRSSTPLRIRSNDRGGRRVSGTIIYGPSRVIYIFLQTRSAAQHLPPTPYNQDPFQCGHITMSWFENTVVERGFRIRLNFVFLLYTAENGGFAIVVFPIPKEKRRRLYLTGNEPFLQLNGDDCNRLVYEFVWVATLLPRTPSHMWYYRRQTHIRHRWPYSCPSSRH